MIRMTLAAALLALPTAALGQPATAAATDQSPPNLAEPAAVLLPRDTPIELMAVAEVRTDRVVPGARFRLRVHKPVMIDGRVVVPAGTPAFGRVIAAEKAGNVGKSGKMTAELLHVALGDLEIPIEGEHSARGRGSGSVAVAMLAGGLMGLFHRGNNAKIKAGELITGFVAEDMALDLTGPTPRRAAAPAPERP